MHSHDSSPHSGAGTEAGPTHDAARILARISDAYIVLDADFRFVEVNAAAERSMRKTKAELLGRSHWEVFPASHDIPAGIHYRRAARERVEQHFIEHYCYEGYDVHLEMDAYPTDEGGVAVFWRDVTARVKAEQALRASEALARDRLAELEQTYRHAPVGLFTFDREYRFTRINERMAEINGLPAEAHLGRSMWEVVPAMADHLVEVYRPVLERGEPVLDYALHGETLAAPGVPRDWVVSYHPLRSATGEIVGLLGAVLEVTHRIQAETRLRAVLDAVPVGVFVADADGRVPIINVQAAEIFGGAPPADGVGDYGQYRGYWSDTGVALRGEDWALARALRAGERSVGERIEIVRFDGGRRSVLNHAAPIHDAEGRLLGAVAAVVDVTAQVAAEAVRQAELAERAAWFRGVFEQAPMAVVVARGRALDELVFELVNPRWAELLPPGRTFVGRAVDEALPELVPEVRSVIARVLATGESAALDGLRQPLDRDGDGVPEAYYFNFAFHPLRATDGTVEGAVAVGTEITEMVRARREAEALAADLRASDERYALAARATRNAIWDWDLVTDAHGWADGGPEVFGYEPAALPPGIDWWYDNLHPEDRDAVVASVRAVIGGAGDGHAWRGEYRFRRGDGSWAHVVDRGYVVRDATGRPLRMIGALEDVTAARQLEERLRQAQKMEAVGQLAGGVAHDFNNLLTVIGGNLEFLRDDLTAALPPEHPARQDVAEIAQAADRARALVRQLLAFSRQQPVQPRSLDLRVVVRGAESLLRRVIGEEIQLAVETDDVPAPVHADPGQLEQVLLNLAVNARDAMRTAEHGHDGRGGTLTLAVDTVTLAPAEGSGEVPGEVRGEVRGEVPGEVPGWDDVRPGRWVRLAVRDTGHGMDAATRQRAFEPFFTTKAVGQGTGLGLATVHGIVRQAGGAIRIDSAPGGGTTFSILLPAIPAPIAVGDAPEPEPASTAMGAGRRWRTGTILLVEDEAPVRAVVRRTLERCGIPVLVARHGADALMIWQRHAAEIGAVVTDLRMPELGGRALVERLRLERPSLPVVFLSGYAEELPELQDGVPTAFVQKPFTTDGLLHALEAVIDGARDGARDGAQGASSW